MMETVETKLSRSQVAFDTWDMVHEWFEWANIVLPKTDETVGLLERVLRQRAGMKIEDSGEDENIQIFGPTRISRNEFQKRVQEAIDSRSVTWVIGTSLIFEFIVLFFACWRFSRRDF
jgi:hypothetical protein